MACGGLLNSDDVICNQYINLNKHSVDFRVQESFKIFLIFDILALIAFGCWQHLTTLKEVINDSSWEHLIFALQDICLRCSKLLCNVRDEYVGLIVKSETFLTRLYLSVLYGKKRGLWFSRSNAQKEFKSVPCLCKARGEFGGLMEGEIKRLRSHTFIVDGLSYTGGQKVTR